MKKTFIIAVAVLLISSTTFSQTKLIVQPNINLPKDSLLALKFVGNLNSFLLAIDDESIENRYIAAIDKIKTLDLIDEIKGIRKSGKYKNDHFYKPYLTNVLPLNDSTYYTQISFIGTVDSTSILKASFNFIAYKNSNNEFTFSSPITLHTNNWKTKKIGNTTFYFTQQLNTAKASSFNKYVETFNKKLGTTTEEIEIYCCSNTAQALQILGADYISNYNAQKSVSLSSSYQNKTVLISSDGGSNFNNFDAHDLWHSCLHKAIPVSIINKPIDEACAYLYGGSWGLTWQQIFTMFTQKVSNHKQPVWIDLYEQFYNFGDSEQKHLMVTYVINALIVKKLEKENGFSAVIEFLKCGKYEKTNENYFKVLEKLTGINRMNFNSEIWKLIEAEVK